MSTRIVATTARPFPAATNPSTPNQSSPSPMPHPSLTQPQMSVPVREVQLIHRDYRSIVHDDNVKDDRQHHLSSNRSCSSLSSVSAVSSAVISHRNDLPTTMTMTMPDHYDSGDAAAADGDPVSLEWAATMDGVRFLEF